MAIQNRIIFDDGTVLCKDGAILDILYQDKPISNLFSDNAEIFNKSNKLLDTNFNELIEIDGPIYENVNWFEYWDTPLKYKDINILDYVFNKCSNNSELERCYDEYELFKKYDMIPVLQHCCFLVDHWRENGIVWGVGRGSSVSSFILFLIGINRINPLKFNLDISDFLR